MRLNLGSLDRAFPDFLSVDICPPADFVCDLSKPWPWIDSSVEEVRAHDVFEHIENRIQTMNELWRVLIPGGRATVEVPSAAHGAGFACDPTHVSAWCLASFQYFEEGSACHNRFAKSYGITARFRVVNLVEIPDPSHPEPVWKVTAVLEAVK